MTPAIEVENVSFEYPRRRSRSRKNSHNPQNNQKDHRRALNNVSLRIEPGETVALLGPNGSGKSTLLKIIATVLKPDAGVVKLLGVGDPSVARTKLGVVFQRPGLDALMTIRENLVDSAILYGVKGAPLREAVDRGLKRAGLVDRQNDRVKTLSGGLARRADLARALLHQPPIVLLDEPTTGLDPNARQSFLELIEQQHAEANLTVLMTTHLTDEADRFDRVIFMHEGRIVADDTPANLRRAAGSSRLLVTDANWNPPGENVAQWKQTPGGWLLLMDDKQSDFSAIASQLTANNIPFSFSPPTLADAFEQLTGSTLTTQSEGNA